MMTIITDIVDAQHLFDTETGAERDAAKEDLLRPKQLLERINKMMTSAEITDGRLKDSQDDTVMGDNSDVAPKQVLRNTTTINVISSIRAGPLETVTPVWKYSNHRKRKASVTASADWIWRKIIPPSEIRFFVTLNWL
mmetsp:Transcript_21765/g.22082  ORF Transcript_21765/g.22082 Transcript_21765/m.22082 type:complete len:138 (-) Transcript_21765:484-897(-)